MRTVNQRPRLAAFLSRLGVFVVAVVLGLLFIQSVSNMDTVAPANPYANDVAETLPVEEIDARMGKGNGTNLGSGQSESKQDEEETGADGGEGKEDDPEQQEEPTSAPSDPLPPEQDQLEAEDPETNNEPQPEEDPNPSVEADSTPTEVDDSGNAETDSGSGEPTDSDGDGSGDSGGNSPGTGGAGDQIGGGQPGGAEGDGSGAVVNPEAPGNEGGNGGEEGDIQPGELTLVTDLSNRTVLYSEVDDDTLGYYAYLQNNNEELTLEVRWFKRGDTVGTLQTVKEDGKSFSTKLTHGTNTFLVNLRDQTGTIAKSYQFSINYAADEATADNPEVGQGIIIETNLDGHSGVVENPRFTFLVRASSQGKEQGAAREELFSEQITVTFDGQIISNPTGVGTGWYEYPVNFPPPMVGDEEEHTLTVTASDEYGNSKYVDYAVTFRNIGDGEVLGNVSISIDATAVGLGVIDSDIVEVLQGETAAQTLVRFLEERAYVPVYLGDMESDTFYLQGIDGGFSGADISYAPEGQWLLDALEQDGVSTNLGYDGWGLKERDFTNQSGWTVQINGRFPGRGLGAFNLDNGDSMTLFFTLAENKDVTGTPNGKGIFNHYCFAWANGQARPVEQRERVEVSRIEPTDVAEGRVVYEVRCSGHKVQEETEILPALGVPNDEVIPEPNDEVIPEEPQQDGPIEEAPVVAGTEEATGEEIMGEE